MNRIGHSRHRQVPRVFLAALLGTTGWMHASENPFLGNWALTLPNGEAGWLAIVETNGPLKGQLLWGTGSIEQVSRLRLNEGRLERIIETPFKPARSLPGLNSTRQPIHETCQRKNDWVLEQLLAYERFSNGSKDRLPQTQQRNALPASWRCSGQPAGVVSRVCFNSARPFSFRSSLRLSSYVGTSE